MKLVRSFILVFVVSACLDRLDIPIIKTEPHLVVDGMITSGPGPYTVKLFEYSDLSENLESQIPVQAATVSISDNAGNTELLTENPPGTYTTNTMQGVVGREYQLRIVTSDGVVYESTPATLQPAGEITNLYFEYRKNEINAHDPFLPQDVLAIYVDGTGEEGYPNLLRWRWSGIFHITTFPQLRTRVIEGRTIPFPWPCSGVIYTGGNEPGGELEYVEPCTCCDCWIPQKGNEILISDNRIVNDNVFNRVLLTKIPIAEWLFDNKYYFEAQQISVQPEVYDFWKLVAVQQETAQNIFQPNVVSVKGNMNCVSHPGKKVYGIFSVSEIARKSFFLDRTIIPVPLFREFSTEPCGSLFEDASTVKPDFW